MTGLILALQFLTRLPMPRVAADADRFAASIRWFPAAGLVVGAIVAGAGWLGALVDPWVGAAAALAAWVLVTGALHLDGLGDLTDATAAAHKLADPAARREKLLAVLGDPHIGSFGVVAIVVQLLAKLVLLHAIVEAGALALLPTLAAAARIGPLIWARWLPPLHAGLGSRFSSAVRTVDLVVWGALLLAAALLLAPGYALAVPAIGGWLLWLRHRIGGISGDAHGAGIELVEAALLLALAVLALR
ncbi:adenosylcobinamide-GDP ribazoletransferase [Sphingomonas zeicaulis]|uniref:adenosylcobinamide-GDP ribazoletransferase n=1 Tax=Sphingomonas zeicaulis TaxID=1632740 RepID=UPI003D1C3F06